MWRLRLLNTEKVRAQVGTGHAKAMNWTVRVDLAALKGDTDDEFHCGSSGASREPRACQLQIGRAHV